MGAKNHPFSYDPEKHKIVDKALQKNNGNVSAYIRGCIVFYETYKDKELPAEEITRRLNAIEEMLKSGVVLGSNREIPKEDSDFDELLKQF